MNTVIAVMIKVSGRSWWQCRYSDGKVLSEWNTLSGKILLPSGNSGSSRWEEVSKSGMVGLRLLCPNGMAGELEAPEGHKFFQLKVGGADISMGGGNGTKRYCDAHIIGVVTDADGNCLCRAWEYRDRELVQFTDNILNMKYRNIGRLNLEAQQLRV